MDGLKKHLTSNALKIVNGIETVSNRPEVSLLTTTLLGDNAMSILLDKLSECEWTIRDVLDSLAMPKFEKLALPADNTI